MTSQLVGIDFDALDPERLARFWSALLGRERIGVTIPDGGSGFRITFVSTAEPKTTQNRIHFDLTSSPLQDQGTLVDRALKLGARHADVGQSPDEPHVVLADPEGNEFCVTESGNRFLTDTDLIGAVNCDGTQALGYFWSAAFEWPLVWDQDQETAIQSPGGGSKVTWSGPPLMPRSHRERLRLVVAPRSTDAPLEVLRLVALGAVAASRSEAGPTTLFDPDGNEFTLTSTVATST
ncbi:MAG: hypothetical protein JWP75_87 [Frondihabitans sp.]|nr:hypothetical protein [Frondihabitans sp.]